MLHAALLAYLVAAPAPAPVKELVQELEACKDESCVPYVELIGRGANVWPELAVGLEAPAEMTRFWTIGVLAAVKAPAARGALLVVLQSEPLVRVKAAAAFALGNLPAKDTTPAVVDALVAAYGDADVNVRFEAVSALARLGAKSAVPTFIKAVRDHDEDVRVEALDALGALGGAAVAADAAARAAIEERLVEDLKPGVRGHAALALGALHATESVPALLVRLAREFHPEALAAACWALGNLGDARAVEPLRKLTTHKEAIVRQHAAEALAVLEHPTPPPGPGPTPVPQKTPPTP